MLVPYLCCVIPVDEAALIANFRFMTAGGAPIQTSPPANDILSPYFMLRPDGSSQTISAYQPNTSFGDAANGLVDAVTFRVQCIPWTRHDPRAPKTQRTPATTGDAETRKTVRHLREDPSSRESALRGRSEQVLTLILDRPRYIGQRAAPKLRQVFDLIAPEVGLRPTTP